MSLPFRCSSGQPLHCPGESEFHRSPVIEFVLEMLVGPSISTQMAESNRTPSQFWRVCLPSPPMPNVSL